jgi:DNA polymerase-3 subunit epsilon/CBS domain-containing protein
MTPMTPSNATPLIALDALVLDTETTGLDVAKARLVEIGAVRMIGGSIDAASTYRQLVRPPAPVPPAAIAVHGIDDATLADAPTFAELRSAVRGLVDGRLLIGHSIGFDLAVLANEFRRTGVSWTPPRSLCVRMLAEVAEPNLPDYSLGHLAAWLGVSVEERHSAVGDATAAARIFLALLPKLRVRGIRTLAEAEATLRQMTHVLDEHRRAGWQAPVKSPHQLVEFQPARVDLYPYRSRVGDLMKSPVVAPADVSVGDALARMIRRRISSVLIGDPPPQSADALGIVTERDLLRALAAHGADGLAMPAHQFASRPLQTVRVEAFVYRAVGRMERLHVRHLGVTDARGIVCGMISARDLLHQRAREAIWLGDEIDEAPHVAGLARAWAKVPDVAAALRRESVSGREVASVVSQELCALTARAAHLAERAMAEAGEGAPPCAYAVAVLGSAGRGESLLALDQDNALVFAEDTPGADHWFSEFGRRFADILHDAGVPYCKGGVMASNPQWRGSLAAWRQRVAGWIETTDPAALLSVDIFFDLRGVYGEPSLADALWREAFDMAAGQIAFAKLLAESVGTVAPGLGLFGRFMTDNGRIDLKKSALFGIVTTARVLAIRHHIAERATPERLAGLRALNLGDDQDLAGLQDAHATLLDFLIDQQVADIAQGRPATNTVVVKRLSARERDRLRSAVGAVRNLETLTRDLLFR